MEAAQSYLRSGDPCIVPTHILQGGDRYLKTMFESLLGALTVKPEDYSLLKDMT